MIYSSKCISPWSSDFTEELLIENAHSIKFRKITTVRIRSYWYPESPQRSEEGLLRLLPGFTYQIVRFNQYLFYSYGPGK
jgi:hypothetical protein